MGDRRDCIERDELEPHRLSFPVMQPEALIFLGVLRLAQIALERCHTAPGLPIRKVAEEELILAESNIHICEFE